jgi:xanthine phosphoribosyltransferase
MKALEDKILSAGCAVGTDVLLVDSFLNHQIDVKIAKEMAREWYMLFKDFGVTKIVTVESSGIALATLAAELFDVPLVFAKKRQSQNVGNDYYSKTVTSFTHGHKYTVFISKKYISPDDKILLIDDFLAYGSSLSALADVCKAGGAELVGAGVAVEKAYKGGGEKLKKRGLCVKSLAKITSVAQDGSIIFE